MQLEVQYDLDRKAGKISALSSNNLDKYEYLTGEDLGLKPNTIEQAKFEYSPLGKIFRKELDKDDKKEGLFKRLKNIENTQENLIKDDDIESVFTAHLDQNLMRKMINIEKNNNNNYINTKPSNVFHYLKSLSQKAKDLMDKVKDADDDIDIYQRVFISNNRKKFNFYRIIFRIPLNFLSAIYNGEIPLKEAKIKQRDLEKK